MTRSTKHFKNLSLIPLLLASLNGYQAAFAGQAEIDSIESASRNMDIKALEQLSQTEQGYDQALANYRLAISLQLSDKPDAAIKAIKASQRTLEKLSKSESENAEVWALLAQAYGYHIPLQPMRAAFYGPKAHLSLERAIDLAPDNLRVNLVKGISELNTPTMFGGNDTAALKSLNKAVAVFESSDLEGYNWGLAEAYVWRGLTQIELGNTDKALADWQAAVDIEPDYYWAKNLMKKNSQ